MAAPTGRRPSSPRAARPAPRCATVTPPPSSPLVAGCRWCRRRAERRGQRESLMRVLYFAWVRQKVGVAEEAVSPPDEVQDIGGLMAWLAARSPGHAAAFANAKT